MLRRLLRRRISWLSRTLVALLLICGVLVSLSNQSHSRTVSLPLIKDARACPLRTPKDWQRFIEHSADNDLWIETCEDSSCDPDFYADVQDDVVSPLEACRSTIAREPKIQQCTDRLRRFTAAWLRQHDSDSYGFNVSNREYLNAQESKDKPPGMMKIPEAIVAALPFRNKIEEAAKANGWHYLTQDSALKGTRTFVYIPDPDGRFDQWMLLNLKDGKQKQATKGMPISMIAVQKKTAAGAPLAQVRLNFRDYSLAQIEHANQLTVNYEANGKCYACHASGMRQLIPRWTPALSAQPVKGDMGPSKDFPYRRLMEFNKIIRAYGPPDWDGMIIPEDHGPALGRTQGCIDCHDGQVRGLLNTSTSIAQLDQKIVTELSMPPEKGLLRVLERHQMNNPLLSADERQHLQSAIESHQAVMKDFKKSRFSELKNWLLEKSCN